MMRVQQAMKIKRTSTDGECVECECNQICQGLGQEAENNPESKSKLMLYFLLMTTVTRSRWG